MKRTWLLVAVLACGGKKDDAPPPPEAKPTPVQIAPAPATAARDVQVFVNDAPVGKVDAAAIAKWPRLDALVPSDVRKIGTWQSVKLASAKNETIDKPSDN